MKRERSLNDSASEEIGSVEVLEPKIALVADDVLRPRDDFFLDLAILEHRFDDEIAILQFDKIRRGLDARQYRVAVGGGGAAAADKLRHQLLRMILALLRGLRIAIDQHHVEAGQRAHIGDAGAHEARAEHANFLEFFRRHCGGTARAFVDLLHRDEQRADHRRGFGRAQDLCEPARFDAQRLVHRQLQAFIDNLHDGPRRRIIVIGLAAIDGVGRRERHHAGLRLHRSAGQLEVLDVPRRLGGAAGGDPRLGRLHQIAGRHHLVDELHGLGAIGRDLVALEQELQRIGRRQDARHPLRAAGAGKQADFDFRQPDAGLVVVGGDAVMAGQRQLEAAADRDAVDRRNPWLAAGLDPPVQQRRFAAFLEDMLIRRRFTLR